MAYGTPATEEDIEPYYTDIRRGRRPQPELLEELRGRYRAVGGMTPLLKISRLQAEALQKALGDEYQVFLGMKHWHPYIREAMTEMQAAGMETAVGIVLAPHYSRGSIGEYIDRVETAREALLYDADITVVPQWHLNSHYLDADEARVREALDNSEQFRKQNVTIIFTAHSLPERVVLDGDPYQEQLLETSRTLAGRLNVSDGQWTFSFQSAGRTGDPWLGPDIVETVDRLAGEGVNSVLVVPIGFISDHLEILYDIDVEAKQAAANRGIRLERIQSLNDDPKLIAALVDIVRSR